MLSQGLIVTAQINITQVSSDKVIGMNQSRANIDFLTKYEYIRKVKFPIFVFEYPVFGDKYSNIQIYCYIHLY